MTNDIINGKLKGKEAQSTDRFLIKRIHK